MKTYAPYVVIVLLILFVLFMFFGPFNCQGCNSTKPDQKDSVSVLTPQDSLVIKVNALGKELAELKKRKSLTVVVKMPTSTSAIPVNIPSKTEKIPTATVETEVTGNMPELNTDNDLGTPNETGDIYNVPQGYMDVILPAGCVQYWGDRTEWTHQNTDGKRTIRIPVKYGINLFNGLMSDGSYLDKETVSFCAANIKISGSTVTNNWRGENVKNFQIVYDGKTIASK